jgi:hypothetical protein
MLSSERVAARHRARYISTPWAQIGRFTAAWDRAYASRDLDAMGSLVGDDDREMVLAQKGIAEWMRSNHTAHFGDLIEGAFDKLSYDFQYPYGEWDEWWRKVGNLGKEIQSRLSQAGPSHFKWRGYTILNPVRLTDKIVKSGLDQAAQVLSIFKKRGVEDVIMASVKKWRFDLSTNFLPGSMREAGGWYDEKDRSVTFAWAGRHWGKKDHSTLIHEIGHHVHLGFLHPAGRAAWDEPWEEVPAQVGGWLGKLTGNPTREEAIDQLQVPSDYARSNVYEDFAETFTDFVLRPHTLSKQARFRMQRALSLSNLYGKKVMRLASVAWVVEHYDRWR